MQLAREMQADLVYKTWQVHPAIHCLSRAAGINDFVHEPILHAFAEFSQSNFVLVSDPSSCPCLRARDDWLILPE